MTCTIRRCTDDDYQSVFDIVTAAYPSDASLHDPETLRHIDKRLKEKYNLRRYILETDGHPVGAAHSYNMVSMYHPQKFLVSLAIHPDQQGRGLGTRLYDHVVAQLSPFDPIRLLARCRDDMAAGRRFLEKRGYQEENRELESIIHLQGFDPAELSAAVDRVLGQGIGFCKIRDLTTLPDWEQKLYELIIHIQADMPTSDTYTPPSLEDIKRLDWEGPKHYPEGYFVALDGDRIVGVSIFMKDLKNPKELHTDDTGVHRDYRRRGIATALKVKALTWAKDAGYDTIRTANEYTNRAMLSINERLGFEKFPDWVYFTKDLTK
jgi:GNAT superfamily N-acetyltransferase